VLQIDFFSEPRCCGHCTARHPSPRISTTAPSPSNNPVENAICPIAVRRKNWLLAGSERVGQRAANIMSMTQSANGHDPHAYLRDVLTRLPTQLNSRLGELLPHSWRLENASHMDVD
jgi:transposase